MTELNDALSSEWLRLSQWMYMDTRPSLLVYVEDDDDKAFWRKVFACVEQKYRTIDVYQLQELATANKPENDDEGNVLSAKGKDALMQVPNLCSNKVVAVDGDWDVLLPNHKYTERIVKDPYVIATTYYAIENHILTTAAINNYFSAYTGVPLTASYSQVLADFSSCISKMLPYLIVEDAISLREKTEHVYSVSDLRSDLAALRNTTDIQAYKSKLENGHKTRIDFLQSEIDVCMDELKKRGIAPSEYWQIVQGHTLFDYAYDWLKHEVNAALVSQISSTQGAERVSVSKKLKSMAKKLRSSIYQSPYVDSSDKSILKIQSKIMKL